MPLPAAIVKDRSLSGGVASQDQDAAARSRSLRSFTREKTRGFHLPWP